MSSSFPAWFLSGEAAPPVVLVIEDEALQREGLSLLLETWGLRVFAAGDGEQAWRLAAGLPAPPDLILCDLDLPRGADGLSVVRRLRAAAGRSTPTLLITGDTRPASADLAAASGLAMLYKPFTARHLRSALESALLAMR